MKFSLRQLEVFLAIADLGNITKAAKQLSMSQSAASDALKELEHRLDVQLFDRVGKRLKITAVGRTLQVRAHELIQRAQELEQDIVGREQVGQLKVGATLTIGNYLAVPIISAFRKAHPNSQVSLKVSNTKKVVDMVANFELDVGLIEGDSNRSELEFITLSDDELVVICAPGHALAKRKTLSDADLISADWIVREEGSGTRQTFERGMTNIFPKLNLVLELQNMESTKKAVKSGLGLACLSRTTMQEELADGSLIELAVPQRDFTRQFYAVLHKQKYRSRTIEEWLRYCQLATEI